MIAISFLRHTLLRFGGVPFPVNIGIGIAGEATEFAIRRTLGRRLLGTSMREVGRGLQRALGRMQIEFRIDDAAFRRALRALEREAPYAAARALNRTAFEILEAEKRAASSAFEFAGPSTRSFMSGRGSFRFDGATPSRLAVAIMPREKNERLLAPHVFGATVWPSRSRLIVGRHLAVPIGAHVGARGRVRASETPAAIFGTGGRGFVAGGAVLVRTGRRSRGRRRGRGGSGSRVKVLYALASTLTLRPRFDFFRVAREAAVRHFPQKVREEFTKRRGGRR